MTTSKQTQQRPSRPELQSRTEKRLRRSAQQEIPLLQLEDDFAEYADVSAFLCNAFAATLKEHHWLTPEVVSGARLCSCWLQRRASELRVELRAAIVPYVKANTKER